MIFLGGLYFLVAAVLFDVCRFYCIASNAANESSFFPLGSHYPRENAERIVLRALSRVASSRRAPLIREDRDDVEGAFRVPNAVVVGRGAVIQGNRAIGSASATISRAYLALSSPPLLCASPSRRRVPIDANK